MTHIRTNQVISNQNKQSINIASNENTMGHENRNQYETSNGEANGYDSTKYVSIRESKHKERSNRDEKKPSGSNGPRLNYNDGESLQNKSYNMCKRFVPNETYHKELKTITSERSQHSNQKLKLFDFLDKK